MANLALRTFREGDILQIPGREDLLSNQDLDAAACCAKSAYTFLNGKPAAVMAGSEIWPGCWQVWSIVSDNVRGHGLAFTKACKQLLKVDAEYHKVHRYHIIVDELVPENVRWAELLGFGYESTMWRASPNQTNMLMYTMFPRG